MTNAQPQGPLLSLLTPTNLGHHLLVHVYENDSPTHTRTQANRAAHWSISSGRRGDKTHFFLLIGGVRSHAIIIDVIFRRRRLSMCVNLCFEAKSCVRVTMNQKLISFH